MMENHSHTCGLRKLHPTKLPALVGTYETIPLDKVRSCVENCFMDRCGWKAIATEGGKEGFCEYWMKDGKPDESFSER
jgi:hypothetical protein